MILPLLASLLLLQAPPAPPAGDGAASALERTVRGRLDALEARSTLYAKHLTTGREIAVRADEPVNTTSPATKTRLRPSRSASDPAVSRNAASVSE